jgi:hypothetical protein
MMQEFEGKPVRAFVIWESVLPSDWSPPGTAALRRISDTRAAQFWDKGRLISRSMGERDGGSVVWDYIAVYQAGTLWKDDPPQALYHGGPVVGMIEAARAALAHAFEERSQVQAHQDVSR